MSGYVVDQLLDTPTLSLHDVVCDGACRHKSPEECATGTHLVFPYRGLFMHHLGQDRDAMAEPNQVMFLNDGEGFKVSHPVAGGDACLSLSLSQEMLAELTPKDQLRAGAGLRFDRQQRRIDPRAQALVALLRHGLRRGAIETLEAETLGLTLVRRVLGERTSHAAAASWGRRKLADRAKMIIAADLSRRWTLGEIATETGVSPVYLTQVFQQVEGVPLYRYQLRLRLARALDLLDQYEHLTPLALDLGFSSHSHFSAAFKQAYGRSPTEMQRLTSPRA
ncbi:AraC family transcriptional regulator [Caulobacter sp. BP25]|uniref:helix-turn-helix transcriptional regulator n=1 Tax=Caulobacter sp. BP25 TaxID=2048900 RepID=UPI000C12A22E|nr:AraC family transcriptional regulator [Caulobacter sp. BP25]PHY22610.1 AraC family transcriptional regulator [Caulobacter sp. BP25]